MTTYKYTDSTNRVVHVIDDDGISRKSCLVASLPQGAAPQPADAKTNVRIDEIYNLLDKIDYQSIRAARDAILKNDKKRLEDLELEAIALRAELVTLGA